MTALLALALQSGIDWRTDYDAARADAGKQGRLVLVYFFLADRPVCKTMDQETLAHPDVVRAVTRRFIGVRADLERHGKLLESMVGHGGGLVSCVVDATGDVISVRKGYYGPPEYVAFLDQAAAGAVRIQAARESGGFALGEEYRACESLLRAEQCYVAAIEAGKDAAVCHERMARLRILRGRNLEARKHLEEARRLDPDGRTARKDRLALTEGLILAVERRHAESVNVLRAALAADPGSAEADHMVFALGFALHQQNLDKPALETLEDGVRRFPNSKWIPAMKEQIEHIKNPQPDHTH